MLFARFRAFWVPYLAFIAVCGACGAVVLGALVSIFGIVAGALTLIAGLANHEFFESLATLAELFPAYALSVAAAMALGFALCGILASVAALRGEPDGGPWACISVGGVVVWSISYNMGVPDFSSILFILFIGGSVFALGKGISGQLKQNAAKKASITKHKLEEASNAYFASTWLSNPPFWARQAGLFLPIAAILALEIYFVAPVFSSNRGYLPRLGWATMWGSSRQWLAHNRYPQRSSCQSNLKQIGLALMQYQQDYEGFFPPRATSPQTGVAWVVQPYLKSTQLFQCPGEFFRYDGGDPASGDFSDYWFNARFYSGNINKLKTPAQSVIWGDGNAGDGKSRADYAISALPPSFAPAMRHLNGLNVLFADGHVKWQRPASISNAPITTWGATMAP